MTEQNTTKQRRASLEPVPSTSRKNDARVIARQLERKDGTVSESHGDKRGYSWPAFTDGNDAARIHGLSSPDVVREQAQHVHAELLERAPWITELDVDAVDRYCDAEATRRMLSSFIHDVVSGRVKSRRPNGPHTGVEGVPPYIWTEHNRAVAATQKLGEVLGLDPLSRAKLAKDSAWARRLAVEGLHDVAERGRELRGGEPA